MTHRRMTALMIAAIAGAALLAAALGIMTGGWVSAAALGLALCALIITFWRYRNDLEDRELLAEELAALHAEAEAARETAEATRATLSEIIEIVDDVANRPTPDTGRLELRLAALEAARQEAPRAAPAPRTAPVPPVAPLPVAPPPLPEPEPEPERVFEPEAAPPAAPPIAEAEPPKPPEPRGSLAGATARLSARARDNSRKAPATKPRLRAIHRVEDLKPALVELSVSGRNTALPEEASRLARRLREAGRPVRLWAAVTGADLTDRAFGAALDDAIAADPELAPQLVLAIDQAGLVTAIKGQSTVLQRTAAHGAGLALRDVRDWKFDPAVLVQAGIRYIAAPIEAIETRIAALDGPEEFITPFRKAGIALIATGVETAARARATGALFAAGEGLGKAGEDSA